MVAPALRQPFMDGAYWSIVIEITFYAWLALFVALGQFPKRTDDIVLGWLSIALLNEAVIHSSILRHLFMTEYAGFFCAGILIAEIAGGRRDWRAPFLIVVSTVIAASEALVGARETAIHYSVPFSTAMMIALTVLAVALVWIASRIRSLPLPKGLVLAIGGLTYPLYLLHQHIGYIAFNRLHEYAPAWLLVLGTTVAMIALSYAIWRYIEPVGRRLVTAVLNALAEVVLPPLAQFADWYTRKASSWISGVPLRIK
jgi:peptidoglycan/LPS O-acetylase OafA/YrhL